MPEDKMTVTLNNPNGENNIKIACCQFRFEFEYTNVTKEEYNDFLRHPPGELSYYIHKKKLLCTEKDNNFPINEGKKKIRKEDERYGIYDYDCILNHNMEEEYINKKVDIPEEFMKYRITNGDYPGNTIKIKDTFKYFLTNKKGIIDDIGYYEKFYPVNSTGKISNYKTGIRFFSYIIERKNDHIQQQESLFIYCSSKIQLIKNATDLDNKCKNLDEGKIVKSLRILFNKGINKNANFSLYLADDAVVHTIQKGIKWGIINYKYSGFIVLSGSDKFIILDKAKFELNTYKDPWRPSWQNKEMWRRIITRTFEMCHYELSPFFREPEKDTTDWEIFTHKERLNESEFHVIYNGEENIYKANYIKVNIKNPDAVLYTLKEHILKAFDERVNILCLPELSLFLPYEKLKSMLCSVLETNIMKNKNKQQKDWFRFSDILVFSSIYLKLAPDTFRHVGMGIGVNIQFNPNRITINKIKLLLFEKHFYAPVEYSKNNIAPGDYEGMKKKKNNFFKWMNIHYWDVVIDDLPHDARNIITHIKASSGPFTNIHLYPFLCSDFIANTKVLYNNNMIMKAIENIPAGNDRINIVIVPAYSNYVSSFYDNITPITDNITMIVFANAAKKNYNEMAYGHSYIFSKGMNYHKKCISGPEEIDLLHFNRCSQIQTSTELYHNGTSDFIRCREVEEGLEMIIAVLQSSNTCDITEVPILTEDIIIIKLFNNWDVAEFTQFFSCINILYNFAYAINDILSNKETNSTYSEKTELIIYDNWPVPGKDTLKIRRIDFNFQGEVECSGVPYSIEMLLKILLDTTITDIFQEVRKILPGENIKELEYSLNNNINNLEKFKDKFRIKTYKWRFTGEQRNSP